MFDKKVLSDGLAKRAQLLKSQDCLRLFDGLGEGFRGLVIDKLSDVAVVHGYSELVTRDFVVSNLVEPLQPLAKTIYLWPRSRDNDSRTRQAELIFGPAKPEFTVEVDGIKHIVRPERLPQAGIFLDSSPVRSFISEIKVKGRVINTFAYTGSLGIAAHMAGAAEVIQLDSNSAILAWAKENFELNKISDGGIMRFIEDDVLGFLEKEARRIETGKRGFCDLIILDPPTIGRSDRGLFKVHHDLPELIELASRGIERGGYLIITLNAPDLSAETIEIYLDKVLGHSERQFEILRSFSADPLQYPTHLVESSVMRGLALKVL
jgi:23S rRNA (cytosine1962-C5)-methyltransferase